MRRHRRTVSILLVLFVFGVAAHLGGCSSQQQVEGDQGERSASKRGEAAGWDGHDRLGDDVVPERYELDLLIDPSSETFRGDVAIEVSLEESVGSIEMHAEELEFSTVEATRDGSAVAVQPKVVDKGGLILEFEEELSEGPLRLHFRYEAPLDDVPEGLYRVEDDGSWYAFTQFEPLEAREAFPSFDEPRFKTPFDVSVTVPSGMMAASNAPETRERSYDATDADPGFGGEGSEFQDFQTFEFAETQPLPTYLVAFAVGDFDVVTPEDLPGAEPALEDVPVRVLTTAGNGDLATYALEYTPPLLRVQKSYFGSAFPYQKMDLVAVPNFAAGAMENVGLVTFRESILLLDEEDATLYDEYIAQAVMAHEYAHMWFGNSVTLSWWDDLWLNEAFATWMGGRTVQEVSPELEPELEAVQQRGGVIQADSMKKSRAIRQPIDDAGDVYNAFDSITYNKGAAILRMFEAWMGAESFRAGVRSYLSSNRHGVAKTSDLLEALGEAAGEPVADVMSPFLDQPGAPLVTLRYDRDACQKEGRAEVMLEQTRYLPVGSEAEVGEPWEIPICLRYGDGEGSTSRQCLLFDGSEQKPRRESITLDTDGCPTWVHPNADEKGYYHWRVRPEARQRRLVEAREKLTLPERVALLGHLEASLRAGAMEAAAYIEAMRAMASAEHRLVVEQIIDSLRAFQGAVYRGEPSSAYRSFAGALLRPHYERVGFAPREGDSSGAALLRPDVVEAMANVAGNEAVVERAGDVSRRFLASPEKSSARVVKYALPIAARHGSEDLWNSLRSSVEDAPTPDLRSTYVGALGHFEEPKYVRKSLDLFLTDTVRAQNFWGLVGPVSGDPKTAELAWAWMTEHYDAIVEKVGEAHAGSLPWIGGSFCSEEGKKKVESFFAEEEHRTVGTERNLAQAVESIEQCRAYRELVREPVRSAVGD